MVGRPGSKLAGYGDVDTLRSAVRSLLVSVEIDRIERVSVLEAHLLAEQAFDEVEENGNGGGDQ